MKLSELYLSARRALLATEDPQSAALLARNLVCCFTGKTQESFLSDMEMYVSDDVCSRVDDGIARLQKGEPLAYIIGQWEFYGLKLKINEHVLIPRDDTCAVTELALNKVSAMESGARVLDLCTGSGCIGLAIAARNRHVKVTLADISADALVVAKTNASALHLTGRVSCVQADALSMPPAFLGKFDIIISNPPYITEDEMQQLPASVRDYEPHLALFGGTDGLDFYRAIANNYRIALKPGGFLCFEFGMGQGNAVCHVLEEYGYTILERSSDYNARERAVIAQYGRKEF